MTHKQIEVGMYVAYHSIIGGPITSMSHQVRSLTTMGTTRVAFITNKSGCVACRALTPITYWTVFLLYPDYMSDDSEFYSTEVTHDNPEGAAECAQREAMAANEMDPAEDYDATDFKLIAVMPGWVPIMLS